LENNIFPLARKTRTSVAKSDGSDRDDRPAQSLQLKLPHRLGLDAILNRRVRSLAQQDLAGTGRVAESRSENGDVPDRAVVVAALEPDSTERRVARGDADAESEVVSTLAPVRAGSRGRSRQARLARGSAM